MSVYPIYVKLEAEEEGEYKPYRDILKDTALKVASHFRVSIREDDAESFAASLPSWEPFTDSVESLKQLGERGIKRVILSNVDRELLRETIAQNGLEVDGYVTAEDVGSYKPSLAHWTRFFSDYKADKDKTLHVAQSVYHDIIPTSRLGVANAWINRYSDAQPAGVNPSYVLPDVKSLLKILT